MSLGITEKRGAWLLEFLENLKRDRFTVHMRRFAEFLGRLGFVIRVLCWMKPHLAPLYTWSTALDKGTVATMPTSCVSVSPTPTDGEVVYVFLQETGYDTGRFVQN